ARGRDGADQKPQSCPPPFPGLDFGWVESFFDDGGAVELEAAGTIAESTLAASFDDVLDDALDVVGFGATGAATSAAFASPPEELFASLGGGALLAKRRPINANAMTTTATHPRT